MNLIWKTSITQLSGSLDFYVAVIRQSIILSIKKATIGVWQRLEWTLGSTSRRRAGQLWRQSQRQTPEDQKKYGSVGGNTKRGETFPVACEERRASLITQLVRIRLQCRRPWFDSWVRKIPWRRERLHTPVFWPGEFHGLYNAWDPRVRHD